MTEDKVRKLIKDAIERVLSERPPLDFNYATERATAHRLAFHIERLLSECDLGEWHVDCEYNRDGFMKKLLEGIMECDEQRKTEQVFPDIIIHKRCQRGSENNLLVIELKRKNVESPCDRKKLELFTSRDNYLYQYGLYININGGDFDLTWYKCGEQYAPK